MNSPNKDYQLLGGRLTMRSARGGYRAAIDPVLLAASVPAAAGERVLDVGCGTGAAALCLAMRMPEVHVVGIDRQAPLIELATEIAAQNNLLARISFERADLLHPAPHILAPKFDHVMANPPHHKKGSGNPSPDPLKAAANVEGAAALADWVAFCFAQVKTAGTVTFVHRYDRVAELVTLMAPGGAVTVFPLWSKIQGQGAKRVLVQAVKGAGGAPQTQGGLVLHLPAAGYTPKAHAVLRDAAALKI